LTADGVILYYVPEMVFSYEKFYIDVGVASEWMDKLESPYVGVLLDAAWYVFGTEISGTMSTLMGIAHLSASRSNLSATFCVKANSVLLHRRVC
jgi:hypothetical protein